MPVDRSTLHAFVTGSPSLGAYPDTQWGRWDALRRDLLAECRARGVTVRLTGSTDAPVHAAAPTPLADVASQLGERWPDPTRTDGRSWSIAEAVEQVRLCCLALDADDGGDGPGKDEPDQPYRKTCEVPYGSFPAGGSGWIATQGRWGASTAQCIETVGARGFRVTKADHDKNGVAAYPSVYSGAAWASGAARGWKSTRVRDLDGLTTSARFAAPSGSWRGNMSYDIWFDRNAGKHDGLEMMIWPWTEGVNPAGAKAGTVGEWTVWRGTVGGVPVLSYVRQQNTLTLDRLRLAPFMNDAIGRGLLGPDWFLTSPQIGAELWRGGAGFALLDWSFGVS